MSRNRTAARAVPPARLVLTDSSCVVSIALESRQYGCSPFGAQDVFSSDAPRLRPFLQRDGTVRAIWSNHRGAAGRRRATMRGAGGRGLRGTAGRTDAHHGARLVDVPPGIRSRQQAFSPQARSSSTARCSGYVAPQNKFELRLPLPAQWNQQVPSHAVRRFLRRDRRAIAL